MRTRIKTIQVNGKVKAVREWQTVWGEKHISILATSETPKHAQSNICKVAAYRRTQQPTTSEIAWREKENRHAAFMAMPRREYKQVYGI